ncbi:MULTISPECIES: metal ABC transporter solute-binding protein, Zn/Mn family [unclassified Rhizobium]|uniref:metal ABC transporter solute-binding protein, Zn/Mn family n=1 Tax=unclassified Rhizobium TaxID=2613769 RepID=UPI001C82D302|nr:MULTISPECIES: zinc ABC transporter substrate-binding protein [unclassified Rhizobium]MBX5214344.1 zinc ABC transporter solute-binding protein [Rhizobium sp. NLR9a]MBX5246031.1 zinc ABC transporter solute-binding protein [Rhizobium sp. NLR3b]MBX5273731.1 zinc ABC transporter solute-binding protein [Rhizobium sp. NLR13a]MBX5279719.1 zinc ABC transporter solute-binding protein [Rhizobium sp. NLR10a]MBX5291633.1 zinc ABC transporter solute-binding protein [Rhizobium sp. NLR15a]
MTSRRLLLSAAALPSLMALSAAPASAETLKIVASFTVLADVVKEVGGDHVKVTSLVGPNGDPHEFEPSPADAKNLKAAQVTFVSGEGLEGWMDRLITASGYKGKPVTVSEGIAIRTMEEDGSEITDPHVWNSPVNVKVWVANIEKALSAADPADAAAFKANAEKYSKTLDELNTYAHSKFDKIADDRRKVLTSHDAFGYFGREYNVSFLAPLGLSTESEASAADVAKLIEQIKSEHVKAYFFENSNDPRLVKQVAKATGAEPGGELFVESLSDAEGPAPTYEKMFRYNVDQLAAAMAKSS